MKSLLYSLVIGLLVSSAYADDLPLHDVYLEWAFEDNIEGGAKGFRLYKDWVPVCLIEGGDLRKADCEIYSEDGSFLFTLTAIAEVDDHETRHSDYYAFGLNEKKLGEPILQIKFTLK